MINSLSINQIRLEKMRRGGVECQSDKIRSLSPKLAGFVIATITNKGI